MSYTEIIASVLIVVAAGLVIATVTSLWRAPDALTRVNLLGPTVGLAVPLLLVAKFVVDLGTTGYSWWQLVQVIVSCFGVWIIAAIGSFYMGRAIYGVTVTDVKFARRTNAE